MARGINRAKKSSYNSYSVFESAQMSIKPCIFLSHRSLDKNIVRKIANYIQDNEIDIYLDENDEILQTASGEGNDKLVTECIQEGIKNSTHIMCLISKNTVSSWWVPYEIGYAETNDKQICSLKLDDIRSYQVPSFLKIKEVLMKQKDLSIYLQKVKGTSSILLEYLCEDSLPELDGCVER